jgi:hypothetical protein
MKEFVVLERRGRVTESGSTWVNWQQEEPDGLGGRRQPSPGGTSRVTGDGQARICERLGAKFSGPTRQQETEPSQTGLRRSDKPNPIATGRLQLLRLLDSTQLRIGSGEGRLDDCPNPIAAVPVYDPQVNLIFARIP